jgi:phage-related protein
MAAFPSVPAPEYPVEELPREPEVLVSRHRDGTQQRRYKGAGQGRKWKLSYGGSLPLTQAERTTLLNHYIGESGGLNQFAFTHPERTAENYTARYSEVPRFTLVGLNGYTAEVTLEEVL